MRYLQSLHGRSNLDYQGSQIDQVRDPKVRASGGNDKERIFNLNACPACRHGRNIAEAVAKKKQVIAPMDPPLDAIDFLSKQWMKWMCDSDRSGYFSGAACS